MDKFDKDFLWFGVAILTLTIGVYAVLVYGTTLLVKWTWGG